MCAGEKKGKSARQKSTAALSTSAFCGISMALGAQ